ncbi:uncharacterized protein LOC118509808 [Anopheles stephensi]|uniref:uncharacterized protein LOC118509808 n=1 Tax=Anopheles stephensi TaxID=30069 RepID=UPI001658C383|nr:uncharacterized protein LOC118509808 [Anopheles stephensi]
MIDVDQPCRVCLSEGTWNIFSSNVINDSLCTVASINHIRDKLQYVTQLQVDANDGLPLRICELCIVQLNLAYRFKQLAADSDSKLREQYRAKDTPPQCAIEDALIVEAMIQEDSEGFSFPTKQERDDCTSEISLGPTVVHEPSTEHYARINEASMFNGPMTPDPGTLPGMVYLQKDIINPAEDEAFINDIIKKEVISIPWPIVNDCTSSAGEGSASKRTPTPPKQSSGGKRKKSRKSPLKRRRLSASEGEAMDGLEKNLQLQQQLAKKAKKRRTAVVVPETTANRTEAPTGTTAGSAKHGLENRLQTQQQLAKKEEKQPTGPQTPTDSGGEEKDSSKPSKATLRKRRLQKVLDSLRIDMVEDKLRERHSLQSGHTSQGILPLLSSSMKRRNSICVSVLPPWM